MLYLATANFTTGHILPVDGGDVTGRAKDEARLRQLLHPEVEWIQCAD